MRPGGGTTTSSRARISREVNIGCGARIYLLSDQSIEYVGPFGDQHIIGKGGEHYGVPYASFRYLIDRA